MITLRPVGLPRLARAPGWGVSPSSSPPSEAASPRPARSRCAAAGGTSAPAGISSCPRRTPPWGTREPLARQSCSASATASVPMASRLVAGTPRSRGQRDVLRQHLLGPPPEVLDRVLSLELARVDHPDGNKDQVLEVAGKGAEHVEHGVDADAAIGSHQHGGGGLSEDRAAPTAAGAERQGAVGQVSQLVVQLVELAGSRVR